MKLKINNIILCFVVYFVHVSCQKETHLSFPVEKSFDDPDSLLTVYKLVIEKSQHGFEYVWDAKANGFYAGYLDFKDLGNTDFLMDVLPEKKSIKHAFTVIDKKPTLTLLDPSKNEISRTVWDNLDTSFSILKGGMDTIFLRGNKYGNLLKLIPVNSEKKQAYLNGGIQKQIETMDALQKLPQYFKRLFYNGGYYDLHFNPTFRRIYIHYGLVDRFKMFECSYAYTASGIQLQKTFTDEINNFSNIEISLDKQTQLLKAKINDREYPLTNEAGPTSINQETAYNFFYNPIHRVILSSNNNTDFHQYYFTSLKGFTVAGQQDGYGITQIPQFKSLALFQQWINFQYGTLNIFFNDNSLSTYGPAHNAQYMNQYFGIRYLNLNSSEEIPESVRPTIEATFSAFFNTEGFYVIKSGPASYDMVSFDSNPQVWIRFE